MRGERAKEWRLVDEVVKTAGFREAVQARAQALAAKTTRPGVAGNAKGVPLARLERTEDEAGLHYRYVDVRLDRARGTVTLEVKAPEDGVAVDLPAILAAGSSWWPLAMARELDDAILSLRTNELALGTWVLQTRGDAKNVVAVDGALVRHANHWFVRQTVGMLRRTLARLDVSSRSLLAVLDRGSCFAGTLAELAFAADRSYMASASASAPASTGVGAEPRLTLTPMNFGPLPMVTGQARLARRFYDETAPLDAARQATGKALTPSEADALGLVTGCPDELDWEGELRIVLEERAAMSPDALTGLEANLRFNGKETMLTRIFGRLSAWQNWIFVRPNAVGEKGALKVYGKGEKAQFDRTRV